MSSHIIRRMANDAIAMCDEIEALRARAEAAETALKEATTWRPIESAPKDGTTIIGGFHSIRWSDSHLKNDIVRCWWQPEFQAFISSCREMVMAPGYTMNGKTRELHSPVVEPITHWLPLPAAPEGGE